jgi:hypothetical protein
MTEEHRAENDRRFLLFQEDLREARARMRRAYVRAAQVRSVAKVIELAVLAEQLLDEEAGR